MSREEDNSKNPSCWREEDTFNDEEFRRKFSYWKNDKSEPLKYLTVGKLIEESATRYGDRIAVSSVHQDRKLTYEEFYHQVESFAIGLIALDLEKGDHVGIWAPNNIEWFVSVMAIMRAGFVAVSLNSQYEGPELRSAAAKSDVKVMIIGDTSDERNYYELLRTIVPELANHNRNLPLKSEALAHLKVVITMTDVEHKGAIRWNDILSMASEYHRYKLRDLEKKIDVHDVCNIQFSSGSTGLSKGICLTHHMMVNNSYFVAKRMLLFEKLHVLCLQVPLFHVLGTILGLLASVHSGATVVFPSRKFSPTKSIGAIISEKCTILYGTPTMHIDIITTATKMAQVDSKIFEKMSSLEFALVGASFCTPELFKQMKDILGLKHIFSAYGMTEVGATFFSKSTDTEEKITTTVGCVLDNTEIKVIDGAGKIVPFGEPGESCFRGYSVMKCYYKDEKITNEAMLPGGWLRSGDKLILMDDGYGRIVGRMKETIIRGGENIDPSEIEQVLACHPDIIDAQVYAVNDARLGEAVVAAIKKREDSQLCEDEVKKYCERKMMSSKIPKYVEFVRDYPQTTSGKVMKFRLRENFERKYNLTCATNYRTINTS